MGGYCWLAVLVSVALLLTAGHCDVSCANGRPGEKGAPGRNGWPGQKGERGEPALRGDVQVDAGVLLSLKGEMGSRGLQGVMGPKGYQGDLGAPGSPGNPGRPGADGKSVGQEQDSPQLARSAFSVIRNDPSYPSYNKKVTYQTTVVNNPGDFNAATGDFTCRVPGVYYFTFHSMARVSMCLAIANDGGNQERVGFCDYNRNPNNDQVMSGGVVLQLVAGQKVWLVSFRDGQTENDPRNLHEKQIIFSGFLLFSNSV